MLQAAQSSEVTGGWEQEELVLEAERLVEVVRGRSERAWREAGDGGDDALCLDAILGGGCWDLARSSVCYGAEALWRREDGLQESFTEAQREGCGVALHLDHEEDNAGSILRRLIDGRWDSSGDESYLERDRGPASRLLSASGQSWDRSRGCSASNSERSSMEGMSRWQAMYARDAMRRCCVPCSLASALLLLNSGIRSV